MKWLIFMYSPFLAIAIPKFDQSAILKNILVPADAAVNSAIYRLKAYDSFFDYPLTFKLGEISNVVRLETLNCTRFNSICQANVVLKNRLEIGRIYDFSVSVSNSKGDSDVMQCSFRSTNATTPIEKIFPGAPSLLTISEGARRNSEIGHIRAHGKSTGDRKVLLELYGPPQFGLRQRLISERDVEGSIWLLNSLDYERSPSHHLIIYANDPWTDTTTDTRNIASWPIFVSVLDEQDTPPLFTQVPPTTILDPKLKVGDVILTVRAEDGDRGDPRDIRYFLTSDNELSQYFELLEGTGELILAKPISNLTTIASSKTPILLTIRADEVRRSNLEAPSQSSSVQLALIPPLPPELVPKFSSNEYETKIEENSPIGMILELKGGEISVPTGVVVTLELLNNNGTFEINPKVVNGRNNFTITIKNNTLLDYESRHSVQCDILAKEVSDKSVNFSVKSRLIVYLEDIDDNTPIFRQIEWKANLPEHAKIGTSVVRVEAIDSDNPQMKNIKYPHIFGPGSDNFKLNPDTGLITVAKPDGLDTEKGDSIKFFVEATSNKMNDNTATATVIIDLVDINDKPPIFEKSLYEFILDENRDKFTTPAFIKAFDNDTTPPNNEVFYELIEQIENVTLNMITGELKINNTWNKPNVTIIHARAYDGGIPRLSSTTEIKLYPSENKFRKVLFVVPGRHPNREEIAKTLSAIVGTAVTIDEVRSYKDGDGTATDTRNTQDRSIVVATVPNSPNTVVDYNKIQEMLDQRTVEKENIVTKAASPNLWWLFWLLLLLVLLIALIVVICCMCECCPWYLPPRKKKQTQSAEVSKLVVHGSGQGKESKSVQVAEWFGRREAWTPEAVQLDNEMDSLRRHELERDSQRGGVKRPARQAHVITQDALPRDQLYIREGNADILRLITRGNEQQRPITLVQEQPYIIDSGKDILLRRFIDQQQADIHRSTVPLPNAVNKLQAENEMLEASLRHQNALLRQILTEREREMRLETQSLPAGTQTDQDAGTQTEPIFLRPPKRKTRSDNDASDFSDEDEDRQRTRRYYRRPGRISTRRKITTPIQEESETNLDVDKQQRSDNQLKFSDTRSSILRKNVADKRKSKSALKREVLKEISASLLQSDGSDSDGQFRRGSLSDDSLEKYIILKKRILNSSRSYQDKSKKSQSASDLRSLSNDNKDYKRQIKTQSHLDLSKKPPIKQGKKVSSSRYMEWYTKGNSKFRKSEDTTVSSATSRASVNVTKKNVTGTQSQGKSNENKNVTNGPVHPLIQHSEHRFENFVSRKPDDDVDSGIVLTRPVMAQKKSVFTIAYDDMHTSQIRQDSATPPF
ncbi:fat atypical cadherin-related [Holotrichia oblita]|uniref:Fat atypical cadherin-related n=1 Tax=Holotrichia oblita TaxID=644536 RepID=A0ACB9SWI3_HOLOL|nr:fat atypical cadherin-related [Holotrichia oblita]